MKAATLILAWLLCHTYGVAQVKSAALPVQLDVLIEGLGDADLVDIPTLTQEITRRGIGFDFEKELPAILSVAFKAKRDPDQVAALTKACWDACRSCRARVLAPMTTDELRMKLKRGDPAGVILDEARVRGIKDLEMSDASANALRSDGANEDLIKLLIPDDRIPTFPIQGFKTLELKHAEEYDPSAPAGWLRVATELPANSENDFIFRHNGLFIQTKKGEEIREVTAYFNRPAPRNTPEERVDFMAEPDVANPVIEKRGGKGKGKIFPTIETTYLGPDVTGRNAFRIVLANKDATPQSYSFRLRWQVLATPKASAPVQKPK